jgi:TolA-binding protein
MKAAMPLPWRRTMTEIPQSQAQFVEPTDVDVTKVDERSFNMDKLERSRERWRQAALAMIGLSALLFFLSCVQIWGTYRSLTLAKQTSEQAARTEEQVAAEASQLRQTQEQLANMQAHLERLAAVLDEESSPNRLIERMEVLQRDLRERDMRVKQEIENQRRLNPR